MSKFEEAISVSIFKCTAWALFVCLSLLSGNVSAKKVALLIGVSDYAPKAQSLNGPLQDLKAWETVLVRHWGFQAKDIVTLVNRQASRSGILNELDRLSTRSAAGDEVFIFFSGHGSSQLDPDNKTPMPHGTGAFIAYGLDFVIGRTDILPRVLKLEADRQVWMVFDSCYSQNLGRSIHPEQPGYRYQAKYLSMRDSRATDLDSKASSQKQSLLKEGAASAPFPYKNTVSLAAASEGEVAMDINIGADTFDGRPHGAFTNALIPILSGQAFADFDGNGYLDANEVWYAALQSLREATIAQTPVLQPPSQDDEKSIRSRPFLGGTTMPMAPRKIDQTLKKLKVHLDVQDKGMLEKRLATDTSVQLTQKSGTVDLIVKQAKKREFYIYDMKGAELGVYPDETQLMKKLAQESWSRALKALMHSRRAGIMELELVPNQFGSYFNLGETFQISMKAPKDVSLLLLAVNASAEVSVLYPATPKEHSIKHANLAYALPENGRISAELPLGVDHLHVIGFVGELPNLTPFFGSGFSKLNVTSKKVADLTQFLAQSSQALYYNTVELVVSEVPKATR